MVEMARGYMATAGLNITPLDTRGTYYRNPGSRGAARGLGGHDKRQVAAKLLGEL